MAFARRSRTFARRSRGFVQYRRSEAFNRHSEAIRRRSQAFAEASEAFAPGSPIFCSKIDLGCTRARFGWLPIRFRGFHTHRLGTNAQDALPVCLKVWWGCLIRSRFFAWGPILARQLGTSYLIRHVECTQLLCSVHMW